MKKILIADDKATSRELVRAGLEKGGYAVLEASDGIEALRSAREWKPDLIILDLHMPGLDGFAVVEEIRRDQGLASTPVMALTASAMRGDPDDSAAGFRVTSPNPSHCERSGASRTTVRVGFT